LQERNTLKTNYKQQNPPRLVLSRQKCATRRDFLYPEVNIKPIGLSGETIPLRLSNFVLLF
ncbi:MAG: hypothetical protein K2L37_05200, partial [Lactobacillus sp.]|nr:hypothetical protein [Lactobacillus sp.]